jgi:dTDP-4-dehydrorhamnose reductase
VTTHLVIGASGQVGAHLVRAASEAGCETGGTYYAQPVAGLLQLDIRSWPAVHSLLTQVRPAVVYLPASLTNVDYCELHPEESYAINVLGACHVARCTRAIGAKLVYFSSDYVFDGKAGPYREDDPANPLCAYGRQKVMAEHYIATNVPDYLIVRTTVVYGWEQQGKNFVCRLADTLKAGRVLRVPTDQIGSPVYAPNLAQAVVELALADAQGIYHVAGPQRVSRYEFACEAARVFRLEESLIQGVVTSELGQPAPRPLDAGMVVEKAAAELAVPLMDYRRGLQAMASEGRVDV